ncbi:MAG: hypothetical protein HGB12_00915 [Bacteroidetes bacterium]|nr:hypothetical protein [Bacteroidota bacterium]
MKIGIDFMGGSFALQSTIEGLIFTHNDINPTIQLCLYYKKKIITPLLTKYKAFPQEFEIIQIP